MSKETLLAIAKAAQSRSDERRKTRISKNTSGSWRLVWDGAMRKFYPECRITYSGIEASNLKQVVKGRGLDPDDVSNFLEWTIEHWSSLRRYVFSRDPRFSKGPEFPTMRWVLKDIAEIHAKYMSGKPEVQAVLPLGLRKPQRDVVVPAAEPAPARKIVRLKPAPAPVALRKPDVTAAQAEEARQRLGLPKWSDK